MTFKKIFVIWLVITAWLAAKFYLLKTMFNRTPAVALGRSGSVCRRLDPLCPLFAQRQG